MKVFTQEEIAIIAQNQYTISVTENRIVYSLEFKKFIMEEVAAGKKSVTIFKDAGYDPEVLGKSRIYAYIKKVKKEDASLEGLKVPRGINKAKAFAKKELEKQRTSTAIKELQDQIVYLEQEIEFLKKISFIRQGENKDQE